MASSAGQLGSEAWQSAIQRYMTSLTAAQKASFKVPENAETCLDMISQAQGRKKGFTRLMELLKPLIDPLKRFEAAIDVIMQTHGAIASPIWGPLRMAITMASDHFKTLESLAMILYRVVGSLERFTNYETLFKTNPAVQGLLAHYTAISSTSVLECFNFTLDPPFAPWSLLSTRTFAMSPSASIFTVLRLTG